MINKDILGKNLSGEIYCRGCNKFIKTNFSGKIGFMWKCIYEDPHIEISRYYDDFDVRYNLKYRFVFLNTKNKIYVYQPNILNVLLDEEYIFDNINNLINKFYEIEDRISANEIFI